MRFRYAIAILALIFDTQNHKAAKLSYLKIRSYVGRIVRKIVTPGQILFDLETKDNQTTWDLPITRKQIVH